MKLMRKTAIKTVFMALLATIAVFTALPLGISTSQASSSSVRSKPLHFYFHHIDASVSVAGMETHYIMNTTRWFKFLTKAEAYAHSFHKPVGLPKIVVDFYLYPNLAGPVTIDGTWQVFVWVNGSAYKPCSFNVQFKEITIGGETLWNSGVLTPVVISDIGAHIDVPIYNYNLSAPSLAHTFSPGTTLQVEVTINPGAAAECRIWYDSPLYPSKVILPSQDYARAISVKTYDVNNIETDIFSVDWGKDQRRVIVRANVTDPFGGYDIYMVNVTIFDPANRAVLDSANMSRTSDGLWVLHYLHTYEAKWSYSDKTMFGNYTAKVSVLDNNGYYHYLKSGSFDPYIEYGYHIFNIGIVVLHNPTFKVVDDADDPLPRARVYVGFPNGTTNALPLYTDDNGFINLTQVPTGSYTFTIFWKGVIVQQTTQYVDSDGPYTIKCRVYQLTVHVLGSNAAPISGAYAVIYTQAEIVQDFKMTDASGQAVFQLPSSDIQAVGAYRIDVYYSTEYWLTHVAVTETRPSISVTSSNPLMITLADFPPPLWTTIGFWLVVTVSVMVALVMIYLLRTRTRAIYLLKT
jgi:hypothetical protein